MTPYTPIANGKWLPGYKLVISCPGVLQQKMCHGAGAKVGWIKEYRGLTFTM